MVEAYCVKCRKKVNIGDAKSVSLKSGRKALEGKCPTCGTKVFKFVKS